MEPLKKQTTQRERMKPRAVTLVISAASAAALIETVARLFGLELPEGLAASAGSVVSFLAGLIVSRLGK